MPHPSQGAPALPWTGRALPRGRRWPVRLILIAIVFALLLPGLLFGGALLDRLAQAERVRSQDYAQAAALRAAEALDRELANLTTALLALSTSTALDTGDLATFQRQAETVARALGQSVVLADLDGNQLLNTRRPFGSSLPRMGSIDTLRQAVAAKRPVVSNVFQGALAGQPSVVVQFPVLRADAQRGDTVTRVLAMSLSPAHLSTLLQGQGLSPGWLATVADGNGRIVARTQDIAGLAGQQAAEPDVPQPLQAGALRVGRTLDGTSVLTAVHPLRLADWRVTVAVPMSVIEAPLQGTIMLLGVAGLFTMGLACLLASHLARSVARPLQRLARAGDAIARGAPVEGVESGIAEVDAVSRALVQATRDLEHQVAARTLELKDANQRLRDEAAARQVAEEQLRQAQKMEAVGQLTGGIAHDFNNLLTIVIGSLDLLRRTASDARSRRLLDNALEGAARAATLTARLLAFSRRQPLMPQPVDLNSLVDGMSDLLRRTLGDAIRVETVLPHGVWQTHVDPNQMENALLNLAVNARDAIVAGGAEDGRLVIETGNAVLDDADLARDPDVPPGEYVKIAVIDSGTGMAPEVAARVFEPFFTTKPQGQGTGLGLSQVHGFVKQSGGHVALTTRPGGGTTICIYLPRHEAAIAEPEQPPPAVDPGGGGLVVLVVEDDAGVRRYSAEALRELGHVVLQADDGPAALRLLETRAEIDLLLTDVVLPGMNGPRLAAAARRHRPALPVLFASGYNGQDMLRAGQDMLRAGLPGAPRLPEGAVLLEKPFTIQALAARITAACDAPPNA